MAQRRPPATKVLVVDDHRTFAEALALALQMDRGLIVSVAGGGTEGLRLVDEEHPDVVLLDVEMPGMAGIEVIRQIRQRRPDTKIVMLSAHDDELLRARALEAGAAGYVSKLTPVDQVPVIVRRAHQGEALVDRDERNRLTRVLHHRRHQESTERQRVNRLTARQLEILTLLAQGVRPKDIAAQIGVTPQTLRTHVQNMLTRLGVHSKTEAVALAMRQGKIAAGV
jgi:two-component system, NarL family, nitrate/nitrite response regulator NarL